MYYSILDVSGAEAHCQPGQGPGGAHAARHAYGQQAQREGVAQDPVGRG